MGLAFAAFLALSATLLGTALVGSAQAQYGGAPTMVLNQTSVAPGGPLQVTVTGCGPAGSTVDILIDGVVVGQGTYGDDGSFSVSVNVPKTAQGMVTVTTLCNGEVLSSQVMVVTAQQPVGNGNGDENGGVLPFTGSNATGQLLQVAVALIAVGALLLFVVPRRKQREADTVANAAH